ncbi:VOC family protein [Corynebacterium glutamicum]|uniref:VOC family protein n=1 Tax=Corynebacterium glutamicum TaxID=1718 RepID=UPI000942CDC0|nr:VOC family protein [Corynebacterium glutamicum]OKX88826.1 glyoxalase [Corynebacterium glutamicum]QDX75979.1 glyoxalase [Corynebacterium glutamicum]QDX78751.1 glyoxalase [Corynebacterium glutamicum]TWS31751.1 glyoxalase [Corynebacterium glutamicum]TWS32701.1 glyoxalase [Corynebacterium glutamicum]
MALLEQSINSDTFMDAVSLRVGDLEGMTSYYSSILSVEPMEEKVHGKEVHRVLGRNGTPLLRLISTPGLPAVDPRQAGLYHTAFLFDTQESLAATVYRAAQESRSRFVGSSDHLVSEAFYFTDPEGNGIELYVDRPRSAWKYADNGDVRMDTIYLDPNQYLQSHLSETVLNNTAILPASIGHVHLQVGNVERARQFYVDKIGFDATTSIPNALFTSAGGYHHHVAMNTWNSAGAGPRAATLGLADVAVIVPVREDLDMLVSRLKGEEFFDNGTSVVTRDPWGTHITVSLPGVSTDELLNR